VRGQAQQTYRILAETNLAGAINRGVQGGLTDADFNMADPETRKAIKKLFLMQTEAY
jgi:hypothetical protein